MNIIGITGNSGSGKSTVSKMINENYNAKMDDSVILERESWWKETLQSRKFGYNAN